MGSNFQQERAHHFKAERAIQHQENKVCDLADVDHRIEIAITLDKCESPLLSCNHSDRTLGFGQCLLRISPDKAFEQSGLAYAWRPDDCDDDWWGFIIRCSVYKRNMKTSFITLDVSPGLAIGTSPRFWCKCL